MPVDGFSNTIISWARLRQICMEVDVYRAFEGHEHEYLSIDQLHPNHKGYEAMAKTLFQQSCKQL
ncbi:hypothetical protein ACEQPO_03080 [Bacillus sp. SL00103]